MPAIMTHNFFGEQMIALLDKRALASQSQRDAFLLGNQGPDVFFYAIRSRKSSSLHKLGKMMHHNAITAEFDAMRTLIRHMNPEDLSVAEAYLKGFICHHVLDSTAHPFINAQVDEIINAGVDGLGPDARSQIHLQIEADLDSMMLWRSRGVDVLSYRPYEEILHGSRETVDVIDKVMRYVAAGAYQMPLKPGSWASCLNDFRSAQRLLYSPTGTKRAWLGRIERILRPHSTVQALMPRPGIRNTCEYSNDTHRVWKNPYTGETSAASFTELFNSARHRAAEAIAAYEADAPTSQITRNLTFSGAPYVDPS